jgi:hypothetical protein
MRRAETVVPNAYTEMTFAEARAFSDTVAEDLLGYLPDQRDVEQLAGPRRSSPCRRSV